MTLIDISNLSFISRMWVLDNRINHREREGGKKTYDELNMVARRCHYNIISVPLDNKHRLRRGGLKIGIRIASMLLRNGIGIHINLSRRHWMEGSLRVRRMRYRRRLVWRIVWWTVRWTIWWRIKWGAIWIWSVKRRRWRVKIADGMRRATEWTSHYWSISRWNYNRPRTETMPLAMPMPVSVQIWIGRRYDTLRCRIKCRLWLWLCVRGLTMSSRVFTGFTRERLEWIWRRLFESFVDPSFDPSLCGQVPLDGFGWEIVFWHIQGTRLRNRTKQKWN